MQRLTTTSFCQSGRDYEPKSMVIVGAAGNIGGIVTRHLAKTHDFEGQELIISGRDTTKLDKLAQEIDSSTGIHASVEPNIAKSVGRSGVLFLAVKPYNLQDVEAALKDTDLSGQTIVSFLAGKSIAELQKAFPKATIIRTMPNTALQVHKGVLGIVKTDSENEALMRNLFEGTGQISFIEESQMDAFTALVGSGPAYVFAFFQGMVDSKIASGIPPEQARQETLSVFEAAIDLLKSGQDPLVSTLTLTFFQGMVEGGINVGFSPKESRSYVLSVFEGAATLLEGGKDATALMKAIMTPNGTTEAGYNALGREKFQEKIASMALTSGETGNNSVTSENSDLQSSVASAIVAARNRSQDMSKKS